MNWTEIILGALSLIGVVYGSWTTVYLRKEQKRSAKLDNDNKVAESWRALYEKQLEINAELRGELDKEKLRNDSLHREKDELHTTVSQLREDKDSLSTKCAVAELLVCKELNCPKRNPPLGSKVFADEFAKSIESERAQEE